MKVKTFFHKYQGAVLVSLGGIVLSGLSLQTALASRLSSSVPMAPPPINTGVNPAYFAPDGPLVPGSLLSSSVQTFSPWAPPVGPWAPQNPDPEPYNPYSDHFSQAPYHSSPPPYNVQPSPTSYSGEFGSLNATNIPSNNTNQIGARADCGWVNGRLLCR